MNMTDQLTDDEKRMLDLLGARGPEILRQAELYLKQKMQPDDAFMTGDDNVWISELEKRASPIRDVVLDEEFSDDEDYSGPLELSAPEQIEERVEAPYTARVVAMADLYSAIQEAIKDNKDTNQTMAITPDERKILENLRCYLNERWGVAITREQMQQLISEQVKKNFAEAIVKEDDLARMEGLKKDNGELTIEKVLWSEGLFDSQYDDLNPR